MKSRTKPTAPVAKKRGLVLAERRNQKMARSAHAYMRGNTVKFYEWLETTAGKALPEGPPIWICGDCHVGNLGPVANLEGRVDIQIRDLDQTVIGNPAHDLIRLGLSLATAVRSSNLPGITTAHMIERVMEGYELAFADLPSKLRDIKEQSEGIERVLREAVRRRWKNLAKERIKDVRPTIPRGSNFWEPSRSEKREISALIDTPDVRALVTGLHKRNDDADIELLDSAYWVKGCSSLGKLRYAVLVRVGKEAAEDGGTCFLDLKEAAVSVAPRSADARMPKDNAQRVVEGARKLAPNLGERMLAARFGGKSMVVRELLPQDLKLEMEQLMPDETSRAARYLANVVGRAHAGQMNSSVRRKWLATLKRHRSVGIDAPPWLWASIVDLVGIHESAYLEHCLRHQTSLAA